MTIDTNIAVYAFTPDPKSEVANAALQRSAFASNQVGYEFANVMWRKFKFPLPEVDRRLALLYDAVPTWHPTSIADISQALKLADRYRLQFYDALMIAGALSHQATTLYSEDMQHGAVIDGTLRIENPFR